MKTINSGCLDSFAFKRVALITCFLEVVSWKEHVNIQTCFSRAGDWVREGPGGRFVKEASVAHVLVTSGNGEVW